MDRSEQVAPRWLTTKAAGAHTSLCPDYLRKLRRIGGGPRFTRVGVAVRYDINELDAWMAARTATSIAEEAANEMAAGGAA